MVLLYCYQLNIMWGYTPEDLPTFCEQLDIPQIDLPEWYAYYFPTEPWKHNPDRTVSHNPSPKAQRQRSRCRRLDPISPMDHPSRRDLPLHSHDSPEGIIRISENLDLTVHRATWKCLTYLLLQLTSLPFFFSGLFFLSFFSTRITFSKCLYQPESPTTYSSLTTTDKIIG